MIVVNELEYVPLLIFPFLDPHARLNSQITALLRRRLLTLDADTRQFCTSASSRHTISAFFEAAK